jgi:hypothetical protein
LGIPDRSAVELAISFAEIARQDLRASRILYQKELYPQAIFEFQQAVEKGIKSVGLVVGLVRPTRDELTHDIGHTTIFGILVRRRERLAQLRRNLGVLAASEKLEEGKELLMKLGLPWAIPDTSEMEAKMMDERTAREEVDRLRSLKPRDLWKITLKFDPEEPANAAVLKLLREAKAQWKQLDRFRRTFEGKLAPRMSDPQTLRFILNVYGKAFPEVPPLAFVSIWHERETRYPAIDKTDYWDPRMYTKKFGLIKMYPELTKHATRLCDGALAGSRSALKL